MTGDAPGGALGERAVRRRIEAGVEVTREEIVATCLNDWMVRRPVASAAAFETARLARASAAPGHLA
jgi:hypothetical protein